MPVQNVKCLFAELQSATYGLYGRPFLALVEVRFLGRYRGLSLADRGRDMSQTSLQNVRLAIGLVAIFVAGSVSANAQTSFAPGKEPSAASRLPPNYRQLFAQYIRA